MDPFPIFLWCHVPLENLTVCFDPKFPSFHRLSQIRILRHTTQLYGLPQQGNWSFHPSLTFAGLLLRLNMSATAFVAIDESCLRLVILTHGRMPLITSRVITFFFFGTGFCHFCLKGFHLCCLNFWRVFAHLSWPANLVRERDDCPLRLWASHLLPDEAAWLKLHESPFEHCPINCSPLIAFSHCPANVGFLSFSTHGYFLLHYFISDSEVSRSYRLIKMKSYRRLQSLITRFPIVSNSSWSYKASTVWRWTESCKFDPCNPSGTHFCRCFTCW